MLSIRLFNSSNLRVFLTKHQQSKCLIKAFHTSRLNCESETSRLIRLRKEQEAKQEQTTGFDKMINFNEFHLQMMKKYDTPEIKRKRNLALLKMLANIGAFIGGSCIVLSTFYYLFNLLFVGNDIFDVDRSYFID